MTTSSPTTRPGKKKKSAHATELAEQIALILKCAASEFRLGKVFRQIDTLAWGTTCPAGPRRAVYYFTTGRHFTLSWPCGEIWLTYPRAPGVAATYWSNAASESKVLGMAPCPVNTALRHCARNSSGSSRTWFFKKTSCACPPFKVTGTAWEPSENLVFSPVNMARKSASLIPEICTPLFATTTTS